jgi:hypothetical protein
MVPIKVWVLCLSCHTTNTQVYFSFNEEKVTIYFGYNLSDFLPFNNLFVYLKEENHFIHQNLRIDPVFPCRDHIRILLARGDNG